MAHRNRTEQQETEKRHIEEFLQRKGLDSRCVEYRDKPDAVLIVQGRLIGLEHRELTEQDLAQNKRNIVKLEVTLRSEMEKLGLVQDFSMVVTINAAAPVLRKPSEVEGLAQRIAQFASEIVLTMGADPARYIAAPELAARGLADVSDVTINRQRPGGPREVPALVSPLILGAVDGAIRAAIEEKEKNLPDYKAAQPFDDVWLLLVTGESVAQTTDAEIVEPFRFPSAFDAVYLLDLQADQLLRVDDGAEKQARPAPQGEGR